MILVEGMARVPHTRPPTSPRREPVAEPVADEPAPHLAKGTRDVTEQARRTRAIDDDIASVAHDVKTPLSIIMLEASVLEQRLGRALTPQMRLGLERILTNASYIDRLVSDLLGQETVVFQTMARNLDSEHSGISYNQHHTGRPLMTADEVRTMPEHVELLFIAQQKPVAAVKVRYYADSEFTGKFDAV